MPCLHGSLAVAGKGTASRVAKGRTVDRFLASLLALDPDQLVPPRRVDVVWRLVQVADAAVRPERSWEDVELAGAAGAVAPYRQLV